MGNVKDKHVSDELRNFVINNREFSNRKIAERAINKGISDKSFTRTRELITYIKDSEGIHVNRKKQAGWEAECEAQGIDPNSVNHYWYKGKHYSIHSKSTPNLSELRERLIADLKDYAPVYPEIKRKSLKDPHLLVVDPADIHIGKLASSFESGDDYNSEIAYQRVIEGVEGILNKALGFPIEQILFIGGNDILHVDTPSNTTTSGTKQDSCEMWYTSFVKAKRLMVEVLEMLITVAPVHFLYCPSNHDFMSGFQLCDSVSSWFNKCPEITFHVDMSHRKYYEYGENCIGATHGDGAKIAELPLLMAQEAGKAWMNKHRYIYTHHVHHKTSKDFGSVNVESLRSPSGTDSWHHRKGYEHAPRCVEAFIHHPKHGQVARLSHIF